MSSVLNLGFYISVGFVGGFIGYRLKIPAGVLVGSMTMVIMAKLIMKSEWEIPQNFNFMLQVLIGVMVGATFHPSVLTVFQKLMIPVIVSCIVLVGTGILLAVFFTKIGLMDIGTGYLGTSPGAMSALLVMSLDSDVNASVIFCFHLCRVIFVILIAPIVLKFIGNL